MMFIVVFVYSVVQAATEFLPVSSSGHLVLLHHFLPLQNVDDLRFDVVLHWGTLIAVIVAFHRDIIKMIIGAVRSMRLRTLQDNPDGKLAWMLIVATILPAIIALLAGSTIETTLRRTEVVVVTLVLGGILLLLAERYGKRARSLQEATWMDVILVGASQAIALIPGISRSGITIITAMVRNLNREAAVRLSFLLSIPIIFAAGVSELPTLFKGDVSQNEWTALLTGVAVAAIFGYAVIRYLLRFVARNSFSAFAVYRFVLAAAVLATLVL